MSPTHEFSVHAPSRDAPWVALLSRWVMMTQFLSEPTRPLMIERDAPEIQALLVEGHSEEAESIARRAVAARPEVSGAYDTLGVCLFHLGRHEEAVDCYRTAITLHDCRASAWFNLGASLGELGQWPDAIDAYRACIERDPANESAKYNLSRRLLAQGEWEGVIDDVIADL